MYDRAFNDNSFEQFLKEEKLMGAKCKKCGALSLPPRPICTSCFGSDMEWFQFRGKGKLAAFTSIVVAPPQMVKEGFGKNNPYVVGVAELEEGAKMVARITGVNAKDPADIKIGTPVKAEFLHGQGEDGKVILAFRAS